MKQLLLKDIGSETYGIVESVNSLKTNITFCGDDVKTIVITSSVPGEGKTSISFELSKSLAVSGKKVLLVDADIRKSKFLRTRGVRGVEVGLSHYLSGQAELEDVFYKINIKNMAFVPTGPTVPNPLELIESERFERLLTLSRKVYDYIIVDAAPLGAVIDAAIIAKHCDGSIVVIEQGKVSRRLVGQVVEQLKRTETRILGAVLNKVDMKSSNYYYGYYKEYGKDK